MDLTLKDRIRKHWQAAIILILVGFMGFQLYWDYNPQLEPSALVAPPTPVEPQVPENPHQSLIEKIEKDAGMPLSPLARTIVDEEGVRPDPYLDSQGKVTMAIGRNLEGNGISTTELYALVGEPNERYILEHTEARNGRIYISDLDDAKRVFSKPLTAHDMLLLLTDDLNSIKKEAQQVFGSVWKEIDTPRREAILDTLYNLGLPHFKTFTQFIDAVRRRDWKAAASELLLSEAARKNHRRYLDNATVLLGK